MQTKSLKLDEIRIPDGVEIDQAVVDEYVQAYEAVRSGGGELLDHLSPRAIYADFTYIDDYDLKRRIEKRCIAAGGYIAFIDRHRAKGLVFHSMMCPDGHMLRKAVARDLYREKTAAAGERQIEDELCAQLHSRGVTYQRQVGCEFGIADVVTGTHIYEVKLQLDRASVIQAVGQVLCYRSAIDTSLHPVIVGPPHRHAEKTRRLLATFGVELMEIQMPQGGTHGN